MKCDIVPPAPLAGPAFGNRWVVLLGNSERGAVTKTKVVDGSVELGLHTRSFMRGIARELYRLSDDTTPVFKTSREELEGAFRLAVRELQLEALNVTAAGTAAPQKTPSTK